jgi:hypothetical protein
VVEVVAAVIRVDTEGVAAEGVVAVMLLPLKP